MCLFLFIWVCGMVLAKGFWSTTFAVLFPPWSLYLTIAFLIGKLS